MAMSRFEARTREKDREEKRSSSRRKRKGDKEEERVLGKNFCLYAQSCV